MKASLKLALVLLMGTQAGAQSFSVSSFAAPAGATLQQVQSLNNAGQIIGSYQDSSQTLGSFLRSADGSSYAVIQVPGATQTYATALSNTGQVAGYYTDATGTHSFIRAAGGNFTLFDIPPEGIALRPPVPSAMNDKGDLVGIAFSTGSFEWGFLLSADRKTYTTIQVPNASRTEVRGVNNSGDIVGTCQFGGSYGLKHGFLRRVDGTYTLIDAPGAAFETTATAINNRGQILANGMVLNPDGSSAALDPALGGTPAAIDDSGRLAGCVFSSGLCQGIVATPVAGTQPVIRPVRGVISASAFGGLEVIAPGSWIEIYGSNLAKTVRGWQSSDFIDNVAPTSLDGVSVRINGRPAFVSYISPGQVNAQTPSDLLPGAVEVVVSKDDQTSAVYRATLASTAPGVLAISEDVAYTYAVALFPDYRTYALPQLSYPSIPPIGAVPTRLPRGGEAIVLYGIGFGSVSPDATAGHITAVASALEGRLEVLLNGLPAQVTYAGLAPGYIGLYQFNIVLPAEVRGEAMLKILLNGVSSAQAKLYVACQP